MKEALQFEQADLWAIPIIVILYAGLAWAFFELGSYEMTGTRGWRRIPAGARLSVKILQRNFKRWLAEMEARRRKR